MNQRSDDGVTPDFISEVLNPYYDSEAAREVAVSLLNAIIVTEMNLMQKAGREVAIASGRMLMDFALGLSQNPFWQKHGMHLSGVFAAAAIARVNSYEHAHARARSKLDEISHLTARQALAEIAVQVLALEQGVGGALRHGPHLRRDMIEKFGGLVERRDAR